MISVQVTTSAMAQLWSTKLIQIMGNREHTFHLHTNCMMMYRNITVYCKDHTKQIHCVVKCSILMKKQVALGTVSTMLYKVKNNENSQPVNCIPHMQRTHGINKIFNPGKYLYS
jgi:hypothetical protein